jgi:hypothetical protein
MHPIVIVTSAILMVGLWIATRFRRGTFRDRRIYVATALWVVAVWGNYGATGHPWPGGPEIGYDGQITMILVGLVAWIAAITLTVRAGLRPKHRERAGGA